MSRRDNPGEAYGFESDVFPAELGEIARRRLEIARLRRSLELEQQLARDGVTDPVEIERRRNLLETELASPSDPFEGRERRPSPQLGLVGLAISGGGIRSATSALGVIQALAEKGLLEEVDYLSTVSGGGFTGSCLSSVLNDPRTAPTRERFPLAAVTGSKEHPALGHLRDASRYLAPAGLLDRLRIPALLVRGIMNNFAIFLLLIMLLAMVTEVGYQLAWKHELDTGDTLLLAFLGFMLLPMIFPLAARFSDRASWSRRNFSGWLFSVWLLVLLTALALVPVAILINDATRINLAELRTILVNEVSRPFELRDIYKWLALAAIVVLFMSAGHASQTAAKLRSKLILLAIGLLGPAMLLAVYLGIIVSEFESGFIAARPIFGFSAADVEYMGDGKEQKLRQRLQEEFARRGMPLSPSFSLAPAEGSRWVIGEADRAYSLTRNRDEFQVDHELAYPLQRGTVSPALRDALVVKGYALSKHVQVIYAGDDSGIGGEALSFPRKLLFEAGKADPDAAAMEEIRKIAAYARARPAERLQIVGVSRSTGDAGNELALKRARAVMAVLGMEERDRLDLSKRNALADTADAPDVAGWVEVHAQKTDASRSSGVAGDTFYLRGHHEIAVTARPQQSTWTVSMVVHPNLAADALERGSSVLTRVVAWPPYTPIHSDARFSDAAADAALRFVHDGRQQDIVLVIEDTERRRDLSAKVMAAISSAATIAPGFHGHTISGMQVAVLHLHGKGRTLYRYRALSEVISTKQLGETMDPGDCDSSAPAGPAALLCGMRHAHVPWRYGAENSVWFIGSGMARFEPGAYGAWAAKMQALGGIPVFAIDIASDASPDCGSATPGDSCNFLKSFADYTGISANVPDEKVSLDLAIAAQKPLAFYGARSPWRDSVRVRDLNSPTASYALSREGSFVRIEAHVAPPRPPVPELSVLGEDDRPPAALNSFLARSGMKLSRHAYITTSERFGPSYLEHPCIDPQRVAWRDGCVQVNDPYMFEIRRGIGGLKVREVRERPEWAAWVPASLAWEGEVQWPRVILVLCLVAYWFYFNVNMTSLNRFYRDRLSKAYLFGVERRRGKRRRGELFPNDAQKLSALNRDGSAAPYHLINVALNLADSRAGDLRGRNADFFVFSKHFTGSRRVGYVPTKVMEKCDPHLNLGTAMAISGAAAAPNMGTATQQLLVFIMTLLNIRLGYWLPNPRVVAQRGSMQRFKWRLGPGPAYLLREAMGWVHERSAYVNVTDGGHIENLAIYELLRRRCKCIIAIDGEADPELRFEGLMILIRYARIDFGIGIDFDLEPMLDDIRRSAEGGLSRQCWAVGRIDYGGDEVGRLYYLKSAVTGSEPDYIKDYRQRFPAFPHESTAEQFFTEWQFEAYRALGEHIGRALDERAVQAFIRPG